MACLASGRRRTPGFKGNKILTLQTPPSESQYYNTLRTILGCRPRVTRWLARTWRRRRTGVVAGVAPGVGGIAGSAGRLWSAAQSNQQMLTDVLVKFWWIVTCSFFCCCFAFRFACDTRWAGNSCLFWWINREGVFRATLRVLWCCSLEQCGKILKLMF